MPVCSKKMGKKWRVTECGSNKIAKNRAGNPADGGGHDSKSECMEQVRAMNMKMKEKGM